MAASSKSDQVPKTMQEKFDRITAITDAFAAAHLNDEYAQLIRSATAALCRKRPSPLDKGHNKTWACGISHAIGMVNFLFDSSFEPHLSATELYQWFGVGSSTGQGKSKLVRDLLKMHQMDPNWTVPSRMNDNPMAWMLSVNGFIMDVRNAPIGAQVEAYRQGMIPYIPGHKDDSDVFLQLLESGVSILGSSDRPSASRNKQSQKTASPKQTTPKSTAAKMLYTLKVSIINGPMTDAFADKNPEISRILEIRGDQTLAELHNALFKAFGREEEHLYEFQVKGTRPNDPDADRYVLNVAMDHSGDEPAGEVKKTAIADLNLEPGESWGYWFDFGDDWWHHVETLEIGEPQAKAKYPKVTQRVGANPPQYAEWD